MTGRDREIREALVAIKKLQQALAANQRLIDDLREANQQMVGVTIRAQQLTDEAEAAKARAEESERELLSVAEFREMFIAIVGHDLRNPLAAIHMFCEHIVAGGHLDPQQERAFVGIIKSSERMARMITQLLDLTRARLGGGLPIKPTPTDLRRVCESVVAEFKAPVELGIEGDVTGCWDPDRLEEVLSNLVGNAVDHAAPGTAVVVKAHADGEECVVEVSNQGEPIPAEVLPFIFEPFRRARVQKHSRAGNLGLGLYIANQVVLSHGGTLAASSAGGTTTFVMRLPRTAPRQPNDKMKDRARI